ncbi:MAG: helix-turn-helix domain-containing protein, partial [Flavobacteriaceae bacterium]
TPYNYLKKVLLNKAVELLESSDIAVKDVGFCVGYESYSSFSGLFKKALGVSPRQFKQAHKLRTQSIQHRPLKHVPGCFADNKGWKKSNFEEVS